MWATYLLRLNYLFIRAGLNHFPHYQKGNGNFHQLNYYTLGVTLDILHTLVVLVYLILTATL